MNMNNSQVLFRRSCIAAAIALAFPAATVLADDAAPGSGNMNDVTVTVQDLNKVNPLYRYYSGLDHTGVYGSVGLDILDWDLSGNLLSVKGHDIGIAGIQEFGATYRKPGDWKIGLDYNEITKYTPYEIDTKVGGVGSNQLMLNPDFRSFNGLGPDTSLKLERKGTSVFGSKYINDNVKINFSFSNEEKRGEILSSSYGNTWSGLTPANSGVAVAGKNYSTQFFAPQPEDYTHNQVSASIDYFTRSFQITAGYYGSFFTNHNTALNIVPGSDPSGTVGYASSQVPWISLAPSNHSQQFYVQGAYHFSDSTNASFKVYDTRLVQDENFIPGITTGGVNPAGVIYATGLPGNLGGLVDTTSVAAKLTSRLTKDLDLLLSWRYEDRNDKTPNYNSSDGANLPNTIKRNDGKADLSYRLPAGFRLTGGLDYNSVDTPGQLREQIHETSEHLILRKSMSETLNGWLTLTHGVRTGGAWNTPPIDLSGASVTFPTATYVAAPLQFSDRTENKAKLMADWSPIPAASIQVYYQHAEDEYTSAPYAPTPPGYASLTAMGLTSSKSDMVGIDASWAINDSWKANAYYTSSQTKTHQNEIQTPRPAGVQTCAGGSTTFTCVPWTADLTLNGDVFGAGLKGSIGHWDLNAKYLYSRDANSYNVGYTDPGVNSPVPAGAGYLPNTSYSISRFQLTGFYPYSKKLKFRLDYIYDVRKLNDYAWDNWTFSDGTRVYVAPNQATSLIGASATWSF